MKIGEFYFPYDELPEEVLSMVKASIQQTTLRRTTMLTVEQRLSNLENLVHALSQKIDNNKYYTDADMQGNRQSISDVTPYTETKTGYYGEREKTFYGVPMGNITVMFDNYNGNYSVGRIADRVTISFDTLTDQTNITISVK